MIKKRHKTEIVKIETDVPIGTIMTAMDWQDTYGELLFAYVGGRATEYDCPPPKRHELDITKGWHDEYLKYLYKHLTAGKSYESFGGRYFLTTSKKKYFEDNVLEWGLIKEIGLLSCREKWEEMGISIADGSIEKGNASVYNFTMKAIFPDTYGERSEVRHEHSVSGKLTVQVVEHKGSIPLLRNDETYTDAQIIK